MVLVTNVSFESSIGVEVMVIIDSGNNEFTDCRSIRNQCTFISLVTINFTVEWQTTLEELYNLTHDG